MFRYFFLAIILLCCISGIHSQDSTSVYFKTGSHKISAHSQKVLEGLFTNLDYTDLIEIKCIGYSDSTGNFESNQRLSERRAKAVSKTVKPYLKSGISIVTESKGELPRKVDSLSRRVDIIFIYNSPPEADTKDTIVIQPEDPRCFFIDQHFEAYSNARIRVNKKKKVVYLQVIDYPEFTSRNYYYVKNPAQKHAVAQRVKLNWKLQECCGGAKNDIRQQFPKTATTNSACFTSKTRHVTDAGNNCSKRTRMSFPV